MTISFFLNGKKDDVKTLYATIISDARKRISLNLKVKVKDWDQDKQKFKRSNPNQADLNHRLSKFVDFMHTAHDKIQDGHEKVDINLLVDKANEFLGNKKNKEEGFWSDYKKYYDYLEAKSASTVSNIKTLEYHLRNFEKLYKTEISYNNLNLLFRDKFVSYLFKEKNMADSSVNNMLKKLRMFLSWGLKNKLHTCDFFKTSNYMIEETEQTQIALEQSEIKLLEYYIPEDETEKKVKDLFLMQVYTSQRVTDVQQISWTDINNGFWELIQGKGKNPISIPLIPKAQAILNKYKGNLSPVPYVAQNTIRRKIKSIYEKIGLNEQIKVIKTAGGKVTQEFQPKYSLVGNHTARRSFVTISLSNGMNPEMVKKISGHKSLKEFDKYIKFNKKQLRDNLLLAWG